MSRRNPARPPLTREDVLDDLREVLLGIAAQITLASPRSRDGDLSEAFAGIDLSEQSLGSFDGNHRDVARGIDLDRFDVANQIERAFDFATQTGDALARTAFSEEDWNDLAILLDGGPRCSFGGETTPLADEDSSLRRTLDMTLGRMTLRHGGGLTIRQLALLADIGETAVRTSLSAEGIRTEGKPAQVAAELAEPWLRRRRGYVPTLDPDTDQPSSAFVAELREAMARRSLADGDFGDEAIDDAWLGGLLNGDVVACDVEALQALARALRLDIPTFTGAGVTEILSRG